MLLPQTLTTCTADPAELALREQIAALARGIDRKAWNAARCVLADWLEEHGYLRSDALDAPRMLAYEATVSSWRIEAARVILYGREDGIVLGFSGKRLRNYVNTRYPFGSREHHPYKVWLAEMKRAFGSARAKVEKAVGTIFEGHTDA